MSFEIEVPQPEQLEEMLSLFPRLADYVIPERRTPQELWQGDADLCRQWAQGKLPDAILRVAVAENKAILGVAFAQMRPEALSHKPSAHLEVLTVAKSAEGLGVGKALVESIEEAVKKQGAISLTLHVFNCNHRARGFYEHIGFEEELIRCIKDL